jgi:geranylgeranyl transferase type-2 subunit beta
MILTDKHIEFIQKTIQKRDFNFYFTEPTRLSTLYWTINTYKLLKREDLIQKQEILDFVLSCKNEDGGFGGNKDYPSNVISTFNALQILFILKQTYSCSKTASFILNLIQEDGSIWNDEFGESDVRILCSGVLSLHLLEILSKEKNFLDEKRSREKFKNPVSDETMPYEIKFKVCGYIMNCYNRDGGFGSIPGGESHNAFTFCCLSSLRSLGALETFGVTDITRFIVLRQKENGGISGRVGKKEDVCYSFWAYSSMILIKKSHLINENELRNFIFSCQNKEGGFSDRPGNEPDIYHLMFSLAALSLLGHGDLNEVDPGFCL